MSSAMFSSGISPKKAKAIEVEQHLGSTRRAQAEPGRGTPPMRRG